MMQLQAWTERLVDESIFIHFLQGPSASEPRWYCASLSIPSLALVEKLALLLNGRAGPPAMAQ